MEDKTGWIENERAVRLDAGVYLVDGGLAKDNNVQMREGWDIVKQRIDRIRKVVLDILFYSKKRALKLERMSAVKLAEEVAAAAAGKRVETGERIDAFPKT